MLNILLTRPAYSPLYELITNKTKYKEVSPSQGLLYIVAALEKAGHQVEVIYGEVDNR